MAEGIAAYGDHAYLVYESGSDRYLAKRPRNVVRSLHFAPIAKIIGF